MVENLEKEKEKKREKLIRAKGKGKGEREVSYVIQKFLPTCLLRTYLRNLLSLTLYTAN